MMFHRALRASGFFDPARKRWRQGLRSAAPWSGPTLAPG